MEKMTPAEWRRKCEWEGGCYLKGFDYGLTPDDMDDSDIHFKNIVIQIFELWRKFQKDFTKLEKLADAACNHDWYV